MKDLIEASRIQKRRTVGVKLHNIREIDTAGDDIWSGEKKLIPR
jgi:hypothetical protein